MLKTPKHNSREYFRVGCWPNPAQNFVQLQLEQPINEETQVHVFDLFGKQVAALKLDRLQTELVIDVTELAVGRYVVRIASQADIAPISFLKK
jgi:hypothetical protein